MGEGEGIKIWWRCIFSGGGRLSKACADDGTLIKKIFAIKPSGHRKLLGVYFHGSQINRKICGNNFYVPQWKVETCWNLALQLMIFSVFTHLPFSVNKSNFHFKGINSISNNNINSIHAKSIERNVVHFCFFFFQESRDSTKQEPEADFYDMFSSYWRTS